MENNSFDLVYSSEALLSRVIYLASSTELNIFVEDEGKEYEYEEILERLLPSELKINIIFPTGGKLKLEEAFSLFGKSSEYKKCFFIAGGDFDVALGRSQIQANNFIYLKKYNIESYLLDKSATIRYMRPKLKKQLDETEKLVDFEQWESIITPFFKKVFALHFIVQFNNLGIENVGKHARYFINENGLPNENNLNRYISDISKFIPDIVSLLPTFIDKLESIYGNDPTCFICGKYYLESLSRYLNIKLINNKKGYDDLKSYLITKFDISSLEYVKDKLFTYIVC